MATTVTDPFLGALIDGRYEVVRRIARGGMATVYLAIDRRLERDVALKVMHPHLAEAGNGGDVAARFRREARAAARLTHPGLVGVYDQGIDGGTSYLTMEFIDGINLRHRFHDDPPLTVAEAFDVADAVLDALAAVHRENLVHRDVKPENVLLARDGRVKVADFGLARAVTEVTAATTGTILGTVAYLSPELISAGASDARADVYAVGIMLFEMLTGHQPFEGRTPIQVAMAHVNGNVPAPSDDAPWLPVEIDNLVASFTARDPDDRATDAGTALIALRKARELLDAPVLERAATVQPLSSGASSGGESAPGAPRGAGSADGTDMSSRDNPLPPVPGPPSDAALATTASTLEQDPSEEPVGTGEGDEPVEPSDAANPFDTTSLADEILGERVDPRTAHTVALQTNPTLSVTPAAVTPRSTTDDDERSTTRSSRTSRKTPRRRRRLLVVALVVFLLAAGAVGATSWYQNVGPGAWTTVPAGLVGQERSAATAVLDAAGLQVKTQEQFSDFAPVGSVLSADPASGAKIRDDGTVTLVVSRGIEHFDVPNRIIGRNAKKARTLIETAGFTLTADVPVSSDTVPGGQVMDVSVPEGSSQPHDTEITLTVSDGPAPVTIPRVVDSTRDEAKAVLADLGLTLAVGEKRHDALVPKGQIISQSPEADSEGHRTDTVTVVLSRGPEMVKVPDVTLHREDEAVNDLENLGFVVKVNRYLGGMLHTVRFQDVEAGTKVPKGSTVTLTVW